MRNYLPGPLQQQYNQDPRLAIAQSMIQQGSSAEPVGHWAQGLGRLAQTLAGNYKQNKVQGEYDQRGNDYRTELARVLASPNAIQGLSQSSDPLLQQTGLDAQLQQLMKAAPESYKQLSNEEEIAAGLDPSGTYQRSSAGKIDVLTPPKEAKAPQTRTIQRGSTDVYQEWTPETGWTDVSEGPAFAPQQPKDPRIPSIVTLIGPDNKPISLQDNDPRIPDLLNNKGYVQRSGADPVSRPTADTTKNQGLVDVAGPELDIAVQNFNSLTDTWAQSVQNVPVLNNIAASEGYQRARNSLGTIAASYLYSTSGATASPEETNKLVDSVMPQIGDKPQTLADKKARLNNMVSALKRKAGLDINAADPVVNDMNSVLGVPGQ